MALTARTGAIDRANPAGLTRLRMAVAGHEMRWRPEARFVVLAPAGGEGVSAGGRRVPEAGPVREPVGGDGMDRPAKVAARVVGRGASVVGKPGPTHPVRPAPEGNEFCVFAHG